MAARHYLRSLIAFLALTVNILWGAPTVTSVNLYFGPSSGGQIVTISGSGFTGTTDVSFGGVPATSFVVNNDQTIIATTPPHAPQTIFVTVTAPSGTSPETPNAYFVYQGNYQAYVSNFATDNVVAIDTATDTFTTIPPIGMIGDMPAAIAITPDGTKAYVLNIGSSNVAAIDTATNLFTTIPPVGTIGIRPRAVAITTDGTKAYVVNSPSGKIAVIDIATNTFTTIPAVGTIGINPFSIVLTPDNKKAYIANFVGDNVTVLDTVTNTFTNIPMVGVIGDGPIVIAITPDGTKAYVVSIVSDNIAVIDTATDTFTTIPLVGSIGDGPVAIAITSDSSKVYITNLISDNVAVIDTATNTFTTIPAVGTIGDGPLAIVLTPDGTKAYVINAFSDNVAVIDTATNTFTTIPLMGTIGDGPGAIAITPDGAKVYITNLESDNVAVIDTATNTFTTIPAVGTIGNGPIAIAITPDQAPLAKFKTNIAPAGLPSTFDASNSLSPVGNISTYTWNFGDGSPLFVTSNPIAMHTYTSPGHFHVTLTVTNSAGTSTEQIFNPSSQVNFTSLGFLFVSTQSTFLTHNGGPSAFVRRRISVPSIAPVIRSIDPDHGLVAGGTVVLIKGINFTGATNVLFGSTPATSFFIQSDTVIVAIAPPGTGTVHVRVRTPFGISERTPADLYTYIPPDSPPRPPKQVRGFQIKNEFATQTDFVNVITWKASSGEILEYRIYRDHQLTKLIARIPADNKLRFEDHNRRKDHTYHYFIVSVDQAGHISRPVRIDIPDHSSES